MTNVQNDNNVSGLEDAIHVYFAAEDADERAEAFTAVEEWVVYSFEEDGSYTEEQLRGMDFSSFTQDLLEHRATNHLRIELSKLLNE